ncbi:hypothetical protein, partial [Caballeronia sp. BR00000012568055]|uniref:hypothetical protein n=1 Tax=Caballeronia sp. BR00000012568055 TaxID=2918761 RepID=UPI0023F965C1
MAFNTTEVLVAGIVGALAVGVGQLGVFAYQTIFKKKLSPKIARLVPVALLAASIVPARTFVTPAVEEYQFQKKLTDDKMFAAYKQYYPAEFDAFVAVAKADHRNGTSIQEQHEKAYQAGQNMVYRHV